MQRDGFYPSFLEKAEWQNAAVAAVDLGELWRDGVSIFLAGCPPEL